MRPIRPYARQETAPQPLEALQFVFVLSARVVDVSCTVHDDLLNLLNEAVQLYAVAALDAMGLRGLVVSQAEYRAAVAFKMCERRRADLAEHDRSHGCQSPPKR